MTTRRLKVLFVTPWYPNPDHTFHGVFVREHATAVQLYHDVTVLHCQCRSLAAHPLRAWELVREEDPKWTNGIPTYRLYYRGLPWFGDRGAISLTWSAFWGMRRLIQQIGRPDVIHAHVCTGGLPAVMIGKLYGIPTVISEHWTAFPKRSLSMFQRVRAKIAFGLCDLVLPVSQALKRAIENYGMHPAFRVVPNTVNTELFAPTERRERRDSCFRLLFVGGLVDNKGLPWLFEALTQLQGWDWRLDVVGDGPNRSCCERLVARLGLASKVVFHGARSKEQVADYFHNADLFVLPSLVETFSVVTIEAMVCGVPALVTRSGGPEELVSEETGMVVPPRDATALAAALDTMLERLETYDRQAIAASARERFGYEAVGAALTDAYFQAIDLQQKVRYTCEL